MSSRNPDRGVIAGLIVLTLGVLFLLHNFGFLRFWDLRVYWPLALIAAGAYWALDPKLRGFGIVVIGVGTALQASNLGPLRIRDLFDFWPLILIVIGVSLLLSKKARVEGDWVAGGVLLTLGVIFQLDELNWLNVTIRRFWPAVLIVVGLAMLQKALRSRQASG